MKRVIAFSVLLLLIFSFLFPVSAEGIDNIPYDTYTYWSDDSSRFLAGNKSIYEVFSIVNGEKLGISSFKDPMDVVTDSSGKLYILDSGNSRLIILNNDLSLYKSIEDFSGEQFNNATGIAVTGEDTIYIADMEQMRVLIGNSNGELITTVKSPEGIFLPDDFEFRPMKIAVDENGYMYVLCKGSYYGALVFSPEYKCEGFFGATRVSTRVSDVFDILWSRWVMTDKQRAAQIQRVPYQFSDLCVWDGMVYTSTGATTERAKGQIRCLSPTGKNILKNRVGRKTNDAGGFNFADEGVADLAIGKRIQDFVSLDVDNGIIYALDQTYGKVYAYSENCELYTVFGGGLKKGTQLGTFENAVSIAAKNDCVYVLDSKKNELTVFSLNEFGKQIFAASSLTNTGKYIESKPLWENILSVDRNCQLAYKGLARAYLAEGDNNSALKYAKLGWDRGIYDQAFEDVRNSFFERNINWILALSVILIVLLIVFFITNKKHNYLRIKNKKVRIALFAMIHPFDNIRAVKYSNEGSLVISCIFLFGFFISKFLKDCYAGFIHSDFNVENYNSFLTLLGTVGVVILWVICNWAMSVLLDGKAKIKEVFIVACYSLLPQILGNLIYLAASNVLLEKEAIALTVINTISLILTGIILCIGTMIIHEFDFFRFLLTAVVSLIAMAVVIFIIFMVVILLQQFYSFIRTIFIEVVYR